MNYDDVLQETHHPFKVIGYYLEALPKSASYMPMYQTVRMDVTSEQAEIERLKKVVEEFMDMLIPTIDKSGGWIGFLDACETPCSEMPNLAAYIKETNESI